MICCKFKASAAIKLTIKKTEVGEAANLIPPPIKCIQLLGGLNCQIPKSIMKIISDLSKGLQGSLKLFHNVKVHFGLCQFIDRPR